MCDSAKSYPNLFKEVTWPGGPIQVRFSLLDNPPPSHLIANVNMVPWTGDGWVIIRLSDGSWEIPGGTLEPNETYLDTIKRELMEEAGARLKSFHIFGGWSCISLAATPYHNHLPHPEFYRVVGVGEVEIMQAPGNPESGEQVRVVECVSLETVVERFISVKRNDLAELYQLAAKQGVV